MDQEKLKKEISETVAELETMRDQLRVRAHLFGMEAKDTWNKLDGDLDKLDRFLEDASETSRQAVKRLAKGVRAFRAALHDDTTGSPRP